MARPVVASATVRNGRRALAVLLVLAAVLLGARWAASAGKPRVLRVRILTDFELRTDMPDWTARADRWFAELNRSFEPTLVQWKPDPGGDAYGERTRGTLQQRRRLVQDSVDAEGDVVLAVTGRPDRDAVAAAIPFHRAAIVSAASAEPDAIVITRIGRVLAQLFGVPESAGAMATVAGAGDGLLDSAAIGMIRGMRGFDFAGGPSALPGKWERRAADAFVKFETAKSAHPGADAHRMLARVYFAAGKNANAAAQYLEAIHADPKDVSLYVDLANAEAADGRPDEAIAHLRKAIGIDPDDARAHAELGDLFANSRQTLAAIEEYRAAVRRDPHHEEYQLALGALLASIGGGADEAAAAFRAAARERPHDRRALAGSALFEAVSPAVAEQVAKAEAAARREPGSSEAWTQLGLALTRARRTADAEQAFRKSVAADPKNGPAHLALAQLYYVSGRYKPAVEELAAAESAGAHSQPSFAEAVRQKATP